MTASIIEICLKKLASLNFPANLVKLLIFWYVNQQMNVRWKNIVTGCFKVMNGTRQGSVLSPYLFCIYMRDISGTIAKSNLGCHIAGMPINILLYADDLVLLAPSWSAQQRLLNICANVVAELDMKFNVNKSYTLIFVPYNCSRRVTYSFPSFVLDASHLNVVDSFKYLGHIISTVSDDNDDILNQLSMFFARANVLLRRFGKCNVSVKLCLFKTFCTQFYGAALWQRYNITVLKRLKAAYIKCVKKFFGSERHDSVTTMFFELGLPTFDTILHNSKSRFTALVLMHDNMLVRSCLCCS